MTTIDTNVIVRAVIEDGSPQSQKARSSVRDLSHSVLTLPALCEAVWVFRTAFNKSREKIASLLADLLLSSNAFCEREAVEYGISALRRGIDFADAIIAWEGKRLGADEFLSFDRRAVRLLASQQLRTRLLQ